MSVVAADRRDDRVEGVGAVGAPYRARAGMEGAGAAGGHSRVHHVVRGCRGRAKGRVLHVPGASLEIDYKILLHKYLNRHAYLVPMF